MGGSVLSAYLSWIFSGFGLLGFQHFYLGDDRKTFLYLTSLGGFGLAALRDVWCIPSYVRESADAPRKRSFFLIFGAFCFGYFYAKIFGAAYTGFLSANLREVYWYVPLLLRAIGITLGSYLVLNSGTRTCGVKPWSMFLVACAIQFLVAFVLPQHIDKAYLPSPLTAGALLTAAFGYRFRQFGAKSRASKSYTVVRILRLLIFLWLFLVVVAFAFIYNAKISVENTNGQGKTVETTWLYKSDMDTLTWDELQSFFLHMVIDMEELKQFATDSGEISEAYEILGLEEGEATMRDVKKRFRKLAVTLFPDKVSDPALKADAEKKFAEVQAAYSLLIEKFGRMQKEEGDGKDEL